MNFKTLLPLLLLLLSPATISHAGAEESVVAQELPDFDNAKTLQEILAEAILRDTLEERGPEGAILFYAPDSRTPYPGWSKRLFENGKVKPLGHVKGGLPDGPYSAWHENGQKSQEGCLKEGKSEGPLTRWDKNGQKLHQLHFKNGKQVFEGEPDLEDAETIRQILETALNWDTFNRDEQTGLYHAPDQPEPYTGWIKKLHGHGKVALLGALKDGEPAGLWTWWDENGLKEDEKRHAAATP